MNHPTKHIRLDGRYLLVRDEASWMIAEQVRKPTAKRPYVGLTWHATLEQAMEGWANRRILTGPSLTVEALLSELKALRGELMGIAQRVGESIQPNASIIADLPPVSSPHCLPSVISTSNDGAGKGRGSVCVTHHECARTVQGHEDGD